MIVQKIYDNAIICNPFLGCSLKSLSLHFAGWTEIDLGVCKYFTNYPVGTGSSYPGGKATGA
jgi:hypothetical protein